MILKEKDFIIKSMKWWYVLVIFLGIVLGLVLLSNNIIMNKDNLTIVDRAELKGEVANLPTIMTIG